MKAISVHIAVRDYGASTYTRVPVRAYASATPGLAVRCLDHPGFVGKWTIDHIPSGKGLLGGHDTRAEALARAERLGHLGDWTVEQPKIGPCDRCAALTGAAEPCERCADLGVVVSAGSQFEWGRSA